MNAPTAPMSPRMQIKAAAVKHPLFELVLLNLSGAEIRNTASSLSISAFDSLRLKLVLAR